MDQLKILCVDDEPLNLRILERKLRVNFNVVTASSGDEALNFLDADPEISMIITDMRMPGMNGLQLIEKATSKYQNKKYYMLSGYAVNEEIQNALDAKMIERYFEKPADIQEIEKVLKESL
ncbi:MAG: hypothetical protein Kapaf2KO_23400 [Candidatus Kapaibacteriales bacterium]